MALGGLIILTGSYLMFIQPVIESWLYIKFAVVIAAIPLAIVGFKKSNKVLVTISLLAFIGLYGFAEMHSKLKPKVETAEGTEAVVQGKAIYAQECVKCHGDNGKLGVMNAADLTATKLTTDEISQVIKNGKGVMPGFTQYSDAEVKAISEYVLTLK
jgi:mono/diheme cytochrome c family protein